MARYRQTQSCCSCHIAEEESEHSSSDDGYDPEGGTFHPAGRPSGLRQRWADGDSYGYGSGGDSDGW